MNSNIVNEEFDGQEESTDRKNKFSGQVLIFFGTLALLGVIFFILTFSFVFAIAAVLSILTGTLGRIKSRKDMISRAVFLLFVFLVIFSVPPLTINSSAMWQYPFQRSYLGCYKNVKEPDWFPDFRDDVQSDYYFDYIPSLMQGTGHFSVSFAASPERAAAYAEEFALKAKYIIPLNEYGDRYEIEGAETSGSEDGTLDVYLDSYFRNGGSDNAVIYVMDAVLSWNHPHSSAVIIDEEKGRIQLSRLG